VNDPDNWKNHTLLAASQKEASGLSSLLEPLERLRSEVDFLAEMAEIAPDNVMWGSDYPHRDGTWPFSRKAIEEQFRGIDPKIQEKMLWDNVRRVYRIDA